MHNGFDLLNCVLIIEYKRGGGEQKTKGVWDGWRMGNVRSFYLIREAAKKIFF